MALSSAPRTPWIVLVIRFRGVRGVGREKREAALKNIAWVWAQFGRWALHCTCIYGTLGKMVLALGAEGFGKKAGWDGGWDGAVGGMRWWWGSGIGQRLRRCDDNSNAARAQISASRRTQTASMQRQGQEGIKE